MKKLGILHAGFLAVMFLLPSTSFCAGRNTGIGVILGEPTGFSTKVWLNDSMAIDGAVAWSFVGDPDLHLHGDVIWHNWQVLDDAFEVDDSAKFPLYYGIGGRLKTGGEATAGIRFVIGGSYVFQYSPFDIFIEIVPIMDFAPETELSFNAATGFRFWF